MRKITNYQAKRPWRPRFDFVVPYLPATEGMRAAALEVGAAEGNMSNALAEFGFHVDAYEPRRKPKRLEPTVEWHESFLRADDFPDVGYDVVLAFSVLHHMDDWHDFLAAALTLSDGPVFVEVPHLDEWDGKHADLTNWCTARGEIIGEYPIGKTRGGLLRPTIMLGQ